MCWLLLLIWLAYVQPCMAASPAAAAACCGITSCCSPNC
jgi:hypothetical protein